MQEFFRPRRVLQPFDHRCRPLLQLLQLAHELALPGGEQWTRPLLLRSELCIGHSAFCRKPEESLRICTRESRGKQENRSPKSPMATSSKAIFAQSSRRGRCARRGALKERIRLIAEGAKLFREIGLLFGRNPLFVDARTKRVKALLQRLVQTRELRVHIQNPSSATPAPLARPGKGVAGRRKLNPRVVWLEPP